MTTYYPYKLSLSDGQKEKLSKAYEKSCELTLRIAFENLTGEDELMLTQRQIAKINKNRGRGQGVMLRITKSHIRSVVRKGGSLFSALFPLLKSVAPTAAKAIGKTIVAGVAGEAIQRIAKKLMGKGITPEIIKNVMETASGGIPIPPPFFGNLLQNYGEYLSLPQIRQLKAGLKSGNGKQVTIKPLKKQIRGVFLGTTLAGIGIPLVMELINKLTQSGGAAPTFGGAALTFGTEDFDYRYGSGVGGFYTPNFGEKKSRSL